MALVLSARPRHRRGQQPCRVRGGGWMENVGGKNSNPGGCIVAAAVITTGKRTPSTLFPSSLPLPLSFFCTKFTEWFRPGRDALKVPRLVITLASRLLFKYRAFSYDLVDCVVKVEVVVAIARHFLSLFFFFLGDVLPPPSPP